MPDIGLLIPLAEILGLSVTELLEGRRTDVPEDRTPEQVEDIVKTAIAFSEDAPGMRRSISKIRAMIFSGCCIVAMLEAVLVSFLELPVIKEASLANSGLRVLIVMGVIFCGYFMLCAPERLPGYYDDNEIHYFSDGFLRMNIIGLTFNNRNWPHILRCCRIWAVLASVLPIPVFTALSLLIPNQYYFDSRNIAFIAFIGGLVIPVYIMGRKYK